MNELEIFASTRSAIEKLAETALQWFYGQRF
jgi:hypothetical protein